MERRHRPPAISPRFTLPALARRISDPDRRRSPTEQVGRVDGGVARWHRGAVVGTSVDELEIATLGGKQLYSSELVDSSCAVMSQIRRYARAMIRQRGDAQLLFLSINNHK